jgi:prephenate dehydratase
MASTACKTFQNATALTAASTTSAAQQLIQGDVSFIGVLVAASTHADTIVDAKIQHSHDGVTWFDLITFTQLTDNGSEVKQVNSDTNVLQFVRSIVALTGGTLASTVTLHLCYDRSK